MAAACVLLLVVELFSCLQQDSFLHPTPSSPTSWVRDLYLWTIFSFAIYMLDTWERCLVWLAVLTISVLTLSSLAHVLSLPVQLPTLARLLDFAAPSIGR